MPLGQQMRIRSSQKNILNINLRKISAFMTHGQFPLKIAQILTQERLTIDLFTVKITAFKLNNKVSFHQR